MLKIKQEIYEEQLLKYFGLTRKQIKPKSSDCEPGALYPLHQELANYFYAFYRALQ